MELDTVNWTQDQLQQHDVAGVALDQLTLRLQTLEHLVERQRQLIAAKVSSTTLAHSLTQLRWLLSSGVNKHLVYE